MSEEMVTVWRHNSQGEWETIEEPAQKHEIHYPLSNNELWAREVGERLKRLEKRADDHERIFIYMFGSEYVNAAIAHKEAGENE